MALDERTRELLERKIADARSDEFLSGFSGEWSMAEMRRAQEAERRLRVTIMCIFAILIVIALVVVLGWNVLLPDGVT